MMKNSFPNLPIHLRSCWIMFFAVAVIASSLTGCVRRRMTIRSNPPGALVYVDDYRIGTTPVSHNFTWYGQRKVQLVKDNYKTLTVMQPMRPPWWQIPPIDFITENILPGELTDSRTLTFNMEPKREVPPDELRGRAEQLRSQMQPVCYTEPIVSGVTSQPNVQPVQPPMPPSEMVPTQPMQPGAVQSGMMMQPGPAQPAPYAPRDEWIPPGGAVPSSAAPTQPYYPGTRPQPQPSYYPQPYTP